jgi:putative transposase
MDISYIPMDRVCLHLMALLGWQSRAVMGWSLSNTMEASRVVETLDSAIHRHCRPEVINSDMVVNSYQMNTLRL